MSIQNLFSNAKWNKANFRIQFAQINSIFMILVLLVSVIGVNPVNAAPAYAPSQQSAAWFDSAWAYRRPVTVSNPGANLTDYQVPITLDGSFNFNLTSSGGSDIRFASEGGIALPFWIESWDPTGNLARIWVKISSIPTGDTIIYLYYGNPTASSASNGGSTFEFFDDDWASLATRWTINGGTPVVNSGIVSFASGTTMQTKIFYSPGHALGYRGWFKTGGGAYKWGGFLNDVNVPYTYIGTTGESGYTDNVYLTNNTVQPRSASNLGLPIDTFHIYELTWTTTATRAFLDHSTSSTGSLSTYIPTTSLPIQLGNYNDNTPAGETFDVDWVYLRNYQESGPTFTIGTEEGNQSADLEITLNDSPDPVMVNALLTYGVTISNHGPLQATGVVLTDALPVGVTLVSAVASQGETCAGTTTVICNLGNIDSGSSATASIVISPTTAGALQNSVSVSASSPDFNTANNSASASTIVNDLTTANLGITQTDSPDPVKAGNSLTYVLEVTNQGPADATGVTVNNALPSNVTYVSATPDQGTCSHPGVVTCDLGAIANGSTTHVTIVVTPSSVGIITNQAVVSGHEQDPFTTNNTTTETTRVSAPSLGAIVLVNSNSAAFADFQHYIQSYLDNFGVPYTVLDIATTPVDTDVMDYALIIIGHRQLDIGNACSGAPCLNSTEQNTLAAAVNAGAGLINFDNDLSANGTTARYQFIQDIFNFGYSSTPSGSGVLFTTAAGSHYITERHQANESISTGGMTLAGITLPADATALATTASAPFLAVRNSGQGRAVQWGTYNWMSVSVKGPIYGLDDLVWRSMAWAARKPFIMQGMPPFLTMRVDDESGPFDWIHVANEFGIMPWAGVFLSNIDATEATDLSSLVNAGNATTAIHAFDGNWFYWAQSDAQVAANFVTGTQWHQTYDIPVSKYVLPHYYQFGSNSFAGLANWGVECVGTQMDPDQVYGAPWIMSGPYRNYETGGSSGGTPQYAADYMTIPGHPEFDGRFFNLVTEIRDDLGYEWYPNNDVNYSVSHGTLQTKRALDSMALATLFTHDQSISGISMENWRAILQGVTTNIEPYHPINVTMDYACQYIKSKHDSKIMSSSYDSVSRQVTVNYSGVTEIPTKYYLFMEDHGAIRDMWVDVPQFTGTQQVLFTLPGELDHIVVSPAAPSVVTAATQQFVAQGYDAGGNPIPNLPVTWNVANGGGTINSNGLFTAGSTPNTYNNTIVASVGSITGSASVTIVSPTLDHFAFQTVANPQYAGAPFQVTITARDASNNLFTGYAGQATLTASAGSITPVTTGTFSGGTWTGSVTLDQVAVGVSLTANAGGKNGTSNSFAVQAAPSFDHFTIQTISTPQIVNAPFQVHITARDGSGNLLPVYTGHPTLSASLGTITPNVTGDFSAGSWNGTVSLSEVASNVTITISDGAATTTSNAFAVQPAPPYYQLTSPSYNQTTGVPFSVTVDAFQATINAWEDNHQDPVLTTTSNVAVLTANGAAGNWTEFLYTPSRPFPTVLASALHTTNLPTMRFYLGGIPNGRYEVIANLYDNASMRYFFGYSSANPSASHVDTTGGATGTEHREYSLGTVDVTTNSFNLYVNNAQILNGGYEFFGWAWIRLTPVQPASPSDITINLSDNDHQDPVLTTTSLVTEPGGLVPNSVNHIWTEFLYGTSRPYPSVMGSALHTPVAPTMHFYSTGIPDGEYQVYANLYDTNPLRYFYGYTSADPTAHSVDTSGGATGTQHREYSLGTVTIANNTFDLYVNRADQLPGATYDIFGWAWIRLSPLFEIENNLTLSSNSSTMQFDADGDGVFGETSDNIKPLVNGTLSIQARDSVPGTGVIIEATDFLDQIGNNTYTILSSNTAPVAADDDYTTSENTALTVPAPGVLTNDTDADNDPLTAIKVTDPAHGTLDLSADGSFKYTPYSGHSGDDAFTYKANDGTENSNTATASITVIPNEYKLTIKSDHGTVTKSPDQVTYHYLNVVTLGMTAVDPGWSFTGWSGDIVDNKVTILGDTTVTANFAVNSQTLTFDSNGGSSVAPIIAAFGASVNAPTDPTYDGYEFAGWYNEVGLTTPHVFSTMGLSTTIYAKWTAVSQTLTFNSNGGSPVAPIIAAFGASVSAPTDPTYDGYEFAGWYNEVGLTTPHVFSTMGLSTTIYAKWTAVSQTLTFNSNGGSSVTAIIAAFGASVNAPTDPTYDGYEFAGWYNEVGLTTPHVFSTMGLSTTIYAKWTAVSQTLTFNSNGGSPVAPIIAAFGASVSAPTDPTYDGYEFAGWYNEVGLTTPHVFSTMGLSTTIYAKWTAVSQTLTFNSNGGSSVTAIIAAFGASVNAPTDPTYDGYEFAGWYNEVGLTTPHVFSTMGLSTTIYAKWTAVSQTLTFNSNGGSPVAPIIAAFGASVSAPTDPTYDGYEFAGWYNEVGLTTPHVFSTMGLSTTIYAKWTAVSQTLTFNSNGGSSVTAIIAAFGASVNAPTDPTYDGYEFAGWYNEVGLTTPHVFSTMGLSTTIYAKWTAVSQTLTFNSNGGSSVAPIIAAFGAPVSAPTDPTYDGYEFAGWYNEVGLTTPHVFSTMGLSTTIYAKWTAVSQTLTFNSNGGSSVAPIIAAFGAPVSAPTDPTYDGYEFAGWYNEVGLTTPHVFSTMGLSTTIYAKWTAVSQTLTFNSNGGSSVAPIIAAFGAPVSAPTDPTYDGYEFAGWYNEVGLTTPHVFSTMGLSTTIYAKWTAVSQTLTFNSNGGSSVAPIIAAFGASVSAPTDPTYDGYEFAGWYNEAGLTTPHTFTTMGLSTTVFAKWTAVSQTLTFNSNGGTSVDPIIADYGAPVSAPTAPTKTGYTFAGWYNEAGLTTPHTFTTMGLSTTVFAKWTAVSQTLSFNSNGGTSVDPIIADYGAPVSAPTAPTKTGYTFAGWYNEAGLTTPHTFTTMGLSTTIYAKWAVNSYTVTYNGNTNTGGTAPVDLSSPYTYNVTVTVLGAGTLTKTGYTFAGWNTAANGSGTSYAAAATFTITANTTLYAQWTALQNPAISLIKSASPATYSAIGQVINYSYVIKNTGDVTLPGPFSISDDKLGTVSCPVVSLAPSASVTCTAAYTIKQSDLDNRSITNTATASTTYGGSSVTSNQATVTVVFVDTTPPDTNITSFPSNPSNVNTATFSFTGTDNVTPADSLTFECKLDSGAWAGCTSPKPYSGLANGSHTFSVRAKDAKGNVDATQAFYTWTIAVSSNRPPVADAGGPYSGYEGTYINLSAAKSTDPDKNIVRYEWDLDNDGQFDDASGQKPKYAFADNVPFPYTIRVLVTDAGGLSSVASATVTIKNVSPVITSQSGDSIVRAGTPMNARATFKDAGVNDTFTAVWKWGDGATSTGTVIGFTVSGTHTYTKPGIYLVTITVKDKDGGVGQASKLIIVLPKK